MGDNQSRWDHLWLSITMGCGFGVSGQPFVGADIGGFQGNANAELFLRWMQYGALTPFCRNHYETGHIDQYAWAFGDVIHDLVRDAVQLRYRLLPYIYASFVRSSETGEPVQRPLVLDFQYESASGDIDDEYLFGHDLLVAPVDEPGMTARQVYLPRGGWYDWFSDEPHVGRGLRHRADPDGPDPRLCPGRLGDPHVAGGPAVHRRLPPRGRGAAPLRPSRRGRLRVTARRGRRSHLRFP